MKISIITPVFAACLAPVIALALAAVLLAAGEMDAELEPLITPDLASAKQTIENLNKLAASQLGADKARTERLATAIKNLFTAEYRVGLGVRNCKAVEADAAKQEKLSRDWLVPNSFGTVNESASQAALAKAGEIRDKAARSLAARQAELAVQLQEVDSIVHDFNKSQELNVVLMLAETSRIINQRAMPPGMFNPSFTSEAVAKLREFASARDGWLQTAKNAEDAENFGEALRYYTKARDSAGRKRSATKLAQSLEADQLIGSAIEYYETAGDYRKAAALRRDHPDLQTDDFRKLTAEDLFAKVAPCCVRIINGKKIGGGFFFKQGGYILTNRHLVIDAAGPIIVKLEDGRTFEASRVADGGNLDLAILKVDCYDHDCVGFRMIEDVSSGLPVSVICYPEVEKPTATLNSGRISNADRSFGDNPGYQLDISANPGNSGGPVVDDSGHLVGVLTAGLDDTNKDRLNFAIKVSAVRAFVKKHVSHDGV